MASPNFNVRVTGGAQIRRRLLRLIAESPKEVGRALYQEAAVEMRESMRRTPVDTGALRASHRLEDPVFSLADVKVNIQVGGPSAPYAREVHENTFASHRVGQAKFLESTIMESAPHMAKRIGARVKLNRAMGA